MKKKEECNAFIVFYAKLSSVFSTRLALIYHLCFSFRAVMAINIWNWELSCLKKLEVWRQTMQDLPVLYHVVPALRTAPKTFHKYLVLLLTFLAYTSYHLSRQAWSSKALDKTSHLYTRKPISIVKNSHAFLDCENKTLATHHDTCTSWITQVTVHFYPWLIFVHQIDGETPASAKTYLGMLDTTYLFSYAFFMFFSG